MQTVHLTNVHVVVIDQSKLDSKQLSIRAYDAANTQLSEITHDTDRTSPNMVTIKTAALTPPPPVTVTVNGKASGAIANQGANLSIAVTNGPGNPKDWIGTATAGSPSNSYIGWTYLNGSHTAPTVGLTSATVTLLAPATAGNYEVRFLLNDGFTVAARATFSVAGTAPPPTPTLTVNGKSSGVIASPGANLALAVANGPGNTTDWVDTAAAGSPSNSYIAWNYLNGSHTAPTAGLKSATVNLPAPATAGNYEARFLLNDGFTVAVTATFSVAGTLPTPKSVTLTPTSASPLDNAASGAMLTTVSVAMSDSSAFSGTISIGANSMAGISGSNVVLTRALTSADDGVHTLTITATQNGAPASAALSVNVMPQLMQATEVITFTPAAPTVPSSTSKGSKVASFTVKMSDGSPFTGTVKFDAPNFDNGGVFALANVSSSAAAGDIIVSTTGPGFDTTKTVTITDHITLTATHS